MTIYQNPIIDCVEPKKVHRFNVKFDVLGDDKCNKYLVDELNYLCEKQLSTINRPTIDFNKSNECIYLPIKLEFYDLICPSTAQKLFGIEKYIVYYRRFLCNTIRYKNGKINWEHIKTTISMTVEVLGPFNDVVEEWVMYILSFPYINFGTLDKSEKNSILKPFIMVQPILVKLIF